MLTGAETFQRYARRGGIPSAVIAELRPVVLYDELRGADWKPEATENSNMALSHPSGELRLKDKEVSAVEQPNYSRMHNFQSYLTTAGQVMVQPGKDFYNFIQTFSTLRAFRLSKIKIGLFNEDYQYTGRILVKIVTGFELPIMYWRGWPYVTHNTISAAKTLYEARIDCSQDRFNRANNIPFRTITVDKDVWIPGGNKICALVVSLDSADRDQNPRKIKLRTAYNSGFEAGRLYECLVYPVYEAQDITTDIAFKLIARGCKESGTATYYLDVGAKPSGLENELTILYRQPPETSMTIQGWESDTGDFIGEEGSLGVVDDGSEFHKQHLKLKVSMSCSPDGLDSPRLFALRVHSVKPIRFCLAESHLFGHPNILAAPPDYSAQGHPLEGTSSIDDSRLVLADPGGMVADIFKTYDMLHAQAKVFLGFDAGGFGESDFIPYRTLSIEDWERENSVFVIHCIDAQMQLKTAEYPFRAEDPRDTEEVHFNLLQPGELVCKLLECAQVRKSHVDQDSFDALDTFAVEDSDPWKFNLTLKPGAKIKEKIAQVMMHVSGFLSLGQDGKWRAHWIDFEAEPELEIVAEEVRAMSSRHLPNLKESANVIKLLFGGNGNKEDDFQRAVIMYDWDSIASQKQLNVKVQKSEILPPDRLDVAGTIVNRILALTKQGIQTISIVAPLETVLLQLGDLVSVHCNDYFRKGAVDPNPILCQSIRVAILQDLTGVELSFQKLLDNEESTPSKNLPEPPSNLQVNDDGDGTASWSFDKSTDEPEVIKYELLARVNRLHADWITKDEVDADGSPSYTYDDQAYYEGLAWDMAVRAVTADGRKSLPIIIEDISITIELLGPPSQWAPVPVPGGIRIDIPIEGEVSGASGYAVYVQTGEVLEEVLRFPANTKRKASATTWEVDIPTDINWFLIKVASINQWGQVGALSDSKLCCNWLLLSAAWTPGAPAIVEGGGYPLISRIAVGPHQAFSITQKIQGIISEADSIDHYEARRRDNESGDWNQYEKLPIYKVLNSPAPVIIFYDNTDRKLKPTCSYRYQVRAVGLNGVAGAWSNEVTVLLTDDTTAPPKPVLATPEARIGANIVHITSPTTDTCRDLMRFKIEGKKGAGSWQILEEDWRGQTYPHLVDDSGYEVDWIYRATAYDYSENPSTVSDATAAAQPQKVDTPHLASGVNATLTQVSTNEGDISAHSTSISQNAEAITFRATITALNTTNGNVTTNAAAITVNAGNINLRVSKNDVINQINITTEEIRIDGVQLSIDADTIFAADVEIQGILKSTGGIKTSTGNDRIEIGRFGGTERIDFYSTGSLMAYIKNEGASNTPTFWIKGSAEMTNWMVLNATQLLFKANSQQYKTVEIDGGSEAQKGSITLRDGADGTQVAYLREVLKIGTIQVIGAQGAAVADATGSGDAHLRLNELLARIRTHGAIAT